MVPPLSIWPPALPPAGGGGAACGPAAIALATCVATGGMAACGFGLVIKAAGVATCSRSEPFARASTRRAHAGGGVSSSQTLFLSF